MAAPARTVPRPAPAVDPASSIPPALRDAVLAWYDANGRRLAFRATRDPYAVLVSELMAQQTQAERAAIAWTDWMTRFPTVGSLAAAPVADVVRAWAGLGYNRRAINLQRAARVIVDEHGGRVPDAVDALEALPGVGPYTARAVAAIAFGTPGRGRRHERAGASWGAWRPATPTRSRRATCRSWPMPSCRPIGPATGRTR